MLATRLRCHARASIGRPLWAWQQVAGAASRGGSGGSSSPSSTAAAAKRAKKRSDSGSAEEFEKGAGPAAAEITATSPPLDLSQYVPQGARWAPDVLPQRWLVFSDLHVSHRTRSTCLAVLEQVHEEAAARGAGILFLGDFWHTRGTLPVEPLNEVVRQLAGWQQPTLMLPGNHDQVSLGGEVHALTPLAAANPAIHSFDGPALFMGALWMPYRRNRTLLEEALAAAAADTSGAAAAAGSNGGCAPLQAVFAHTDILGALMNESYQAHDGLPPDIFPPDIPTYTGHYHKPHTVAGSRITYIGSPYQVTRAEAGQQKRFLLLDRAAGWEVTEEIHLDLGPRYFSAAAVPAAVAPVSSAGVEAAGAETEAAAGASEAVLEAATKGGEEALLDSASATEAEAEVVPGVVEEAGFELLLPEGLRKGDRLMLTLPAAAAKQHQKQLKKLEKQGVEVEVFTPPEASAAPRITAAEGMGPMQLWERYCGWQRLPEAAAAAGSRLLRGLLAGSSEGSAMEQQHTSIRFGAVEVEGYFSFREAVRYDLGERGLVVVTGQVHDTAEAGVESNGAGKTALMLAPLWALTGSVDSRAEGGSASRPLLADIINDNAKRARVRVEGSVNGTPFVVERTANKKSSLVTFELAGQDLTTQENKMTQERIDSHLGAELLGRVVFYGQSDITALLEASDRAFKQELSKLVDLDVWTRAKDASRAEVSSRRDALKESAATLREREAQAGSLQQQLEGLQQEVAEWEARQAAAATVLQQEAGQLLAELSAGQGKVAEAAALGQEATEQLDAELAQLGSQLAELEQAIDKQRQQEGVEGASSGSRLDAQAAEQHLAEQQQRQRGVQAEQQQAQFELGAAAAAVEDARRQQAQAGQVVEAAAGALETFLQQHEALLAPAGSGTACVTSAAAQQLQGLQAEEQRWQQGMDAARKQLTDSLLEAAGQHSRAAAKREQAQQAQQEAGTAQEGVEWLQGEVSVLAEAAAAEGPDAAPMSLKEVKKRRKSMQRQLAAAQKQLGAAEGQARERREQLEEYVQLVGGSTGTGDSEQTASSGSSSSSGAPGEVSPRAGGGSDGPKHHEHTPGAVCDRCHQPISPELFQQNVQRLEAAADAALAGAEQAEQQLGAVLADSEALEAAAAAAERWEEWRVALTTAQHAAVARQAEAGAAADEAQQAKQLLAELADSVTKAQGAVSQLEEAGEQLAGAVLEAEATVALELERQQLEAGVTDAISAQAAAAPWLADAEERQAAARAALRQLEAMAGKAAEAVADSQQLFQEAEKQAGLVARLEQQRALMAGQEQQVQQRRRLLAAQLRSLAGLRDTALPEAAASLEEVCSSNRGTCSSSGTLGGDGGQIPTTSVAGWASSASAGEGAEAALEVAVSAAGSWLTAVADLAQRWRWHQQQPNLPARDAALVGQQLEAAQQQLLRVAQQQEELESEAAMWKQVDDAFLPRGVVNFVVEGVLGDLQAATSRNLSCLTSGMSLTLSPCKASKKKGDVEGMIEQIEKIVHIRQPGSLDMRQRSVRQLSGGERRRVALALALGFSELAAQRGRLRSNLIVLDEVMQHLDGEGCLRVAQLLKQLPYESILVVAQAHSLLTQAFDSTDVVIKAGGHSTVEQGSMVPVS